MGQKVWRTLPHLSEWSHFKLSYSLFTYAVRSCSHPLCPANFFLDLKLKQIPHHLQHAIHKQMKEEQRQKKS